MNAQENKKSYNTQEMKVIINGDKVIMNGDTLSNQSSREIISQIRWTLEAEQRRKEDKKRMQEINNKNSNTSNTTSNKPDPAKVQKRDNEDPTPIPSPFQKDEKSGCGSSNLEYIGKLENGKSVKVSYRNIATKYVPKEEFSYNKPVTNPDPNIYKNIKREEVINFDTDESYFTTYAWVYVINKYADYWIYLYERESDDKDASLLPSHITVTIYKGNVMKKLEEAHSAPVNRSGWYRTDKGEEFFTFFGGRGERLHAAVVKNGNTLIVSANEKYEYFKQHLEKLINFNVTEPNKYFVENDCGSSGLYEFRKNSELVDHGETGEGYIK